MQAKEGEQDQEQEEEDGEAVHDDDDDDDEEEDGSTEGSGATPPPSSPSPAPPASTSTAQQQQLQPEEGELQSMYAQATELLVLRVLIPRGEGPAAMALLQELKQGPEGGRDGGGVSLLEPGHRQVWDGC